MSLQRTPRGKLAMQPLISKEPATSVFVIRRFSLERVDFAVGVRARLEGPSREVNQFSESNRSLSRGFEFCGENVLLVPNRGGDVS